MFRCYLKFTIGVPCDSFRPLSRSRNSFWSAIVNWTPPSTVSTPQLEASTRATPEQSASMSCQLIQQTLYIFFSGLLFFTRLRFTIRSRRMSFMPLTGSHTCEDLQEKEWTSKCLDGRPVGEAFWLSSYLHFQQPVSNSFLLNLEKLASTSPQSNDYIMWPTCSSVGHEKTKKSPHKEQVESVTWWPLYFDYLSNLSKSKPFSIAAH